MNHDLPGGYTLDEWLAGKVPRLTTAERKVAWEARTQVRQRRQIEIAARSQAAHLASRHRQNLYRRALEP